MTVMCLCKHSFHFFYRDLLLKWIWDALKEINYFFRDLCSNKLHTQHMKKFEMNIV
jgi:hypothetical protein